MTLPSSLYRDISPPRVPKRRKKSEVQSQSPKTRVLYDASNDPTLAAVEAGRARIEDHLTYFKHHLAKASRRTPQDAPRLSIDNFAKLYRSNEHNNGHHFVIHQHNHPKAGVHYDLRLQFSTSSSVSWAFPKGLPGNPNSRQLGRMAVETRVHNLWNNLIESASMKTGSLLVWDTGTYSILPSKKNQNEIPSPQTTDEECETDEKSFENPIPEKEKLIDAFRSRHIRLRLHGIRLPKDYTITLRLPSNNDNPPSKPASRRRKRRSVAPSRRLSQTSDSDSTTIASKTANDGVQHADANADLDTDSEEDALTGAQNAYPGSTNSIGSIHQRRWFVLLDRQSSGFELHDGRWVRRLLPSGELGGFDPFVVRGRDYERSVVTGRLARDVESDEGCESYVGRGGWKSIED